MPVEGPHSEPGRDARRRLIIVLPNLRVGGTERVMLHVANALSLQADVTLALVRPQGELLERLAPGVRVVPLGGSIAWPFRFLRMVWRERPHAVLGAMVDINIALQALRWLMPKSLRLVIRESSSPSAWLVYWRYPRITEFLYRITHRMADRIVVLTRAMEDEMKSMIGANGPRIDIIPNAVANDRLDANAAGPSFAKPYLIAVGRLVGEKGYDLLIQAFGHIAAQFPSHRLFIVGDGIERRRLEVLVERLGLSGRIELAGHMDDPLPAVRAAELFILSSRVEGMSNALLEALCVGTPVLAVAERTGADEIITDGENGFLVQRCERDMLAGGLVRALREANRLDRETIASHARSRYGMSAMIEAYQQALFG
ncbi:MAG: glycosyltransferase [Methylotetracoccus sp.]